MLQGSPKNQMVELYPTVNCIVHLASKPVFIAELDEVDMVYYERVQPGGSNFDLAFIYKKFLNTNPAPKLAECWERIGTIDMKFMDSVKEVLLHAPHVARVTRVTVADSTGLAQQRQGGAARLVGLPHLTLVTHITHYSYY